jgi:quinol monooxygenase YgiN
VQVGPSLAVVVTADLFTPVVDDAYTFGRIAATNTLSDIYAMGGEPPVGLNLLGWPRDKLPADLAAEVLRGGLNVGHAAQCHVAGGHSIDDPEPGACQASSAMRAGAQRAPDVGERLHRAGEEHHAETADTHVIASRPQAVHLSIGQPVGNVAQTFPVRQPPGQLEHGRGNVRAEDGSRGRGAAGGAGGPARPAAYVEHTLGGTDVGGGMQPLFMQPRLGIEQSGAPDPELPRGLVRIDPRPDIRLTTHPHHHPRTLAPAYPSQTPSGRSFDGLSSERSYCLCPLIGCDRKRLEAGSVSELQGIGRFKFHEAGKLEEFKRLSAQAMEIVRAKDTGTLQYEIYFSDDQSECIVLERYRDSDALIKHAANLGELGAAILATGLVSSQLLDEPGAELRAKLADGPVRSLRPSCQCRHRRRPERDIAHAVADGKDLL